MRSPFSQSWQTDMLKNTLKWQYPASVWLTLILLALSAWMLGKMVWMLQSEQTVPVWTPTSSVTQVKSASYDMTALQKSSLFGKYSEKRQPVMQKVADAPKTRLNLVLVGVVASNEPLKNLAVIAHGGAQLTYGLDEVIEGTRVKLKAVLPDRVIIDNSGRDETLMLEGLDYSKRSITSSNSQPSARSVSNDDKLDAIRKAIVQNPQEIFQYVRLSLVKEGDEILGYRVSPGKDVALFESVGLKNGDIATQFNGFDLTQPDVMNKLASTVSDMTEINLTVEREGQQYDIYIQF